MVHEVVASARSIHAYRLRLVCLASEGLRRGWRTEGVKVANLTSKLEILCFCSDFKLFLPEKRDNSVGGSMWLHSLALSLSLSPTLSCQSLFATL